MSGGRACGILLRNEWFKARKSLAFRLPLGFYAFWVFVNHANAFFRDEDSVRFPEIWSSIFGVGTPFVLVFSVLTLLLLTASEFNWRTARQNVIDGLSKSQWFRGKFLLFPIVGTAFIAVHILIPVALALIRTDFGGTEGPLVSAPVFAATGGLILAFLSASAFAFFLAMTIRRSAPAVGVWFLWVFPLESGMITPVVNRYLPEFSDWIRYLPWINTFPLLEFRNYDAAAYERYAAPALEVGGTPMPAVDPTSHLLVAAAWAVLFLGTAFIWFRRRDL
ncbi:hypothetical protein [Candidatus Palauibacter sp.]|uniref:hypothetical protein n=1 Tax=Candidatus Palauibacter sp. TaxID=3101350 RepID=UPI003B01DEA9